MDTGGALLGPLVTFALLALVPGAFDTVFVVSFCFAVVGLGVLGLFVSNPPVEAPEEDKEAVRPSVRSAFGLLGRRNFAWLVVIGAVLSLVTISDAFIYLALQQRLDFNEDLLPLLFVGTALVYMVLAIPVGQIADRFGRPRVFLVGYALLLAVYLLLIASQAGIVILALSILLLGAYYAATDGVLMAIASVALPAPLVGTGLGLLVTATSLARIVAAIAFGAIWTSSGSGTALAVFAAGLAVALAAAAFAFLRLRGNTDGQLAAA
jgi:predicted MFS family arabinose efflux permease